MLLQTLEHFNPGLTVNQVLLLDIEDNDPLVWFIARTLHFSWSHRVVGKRAVPAAWIASLRADHAIMMEAQQNQFELMVGNILDSIRVATWV